MSTKPINISTRDCRLCKAHSRSGELCKRYAMAGQAVCATHGGRAPQNKKKAEERIREARDLALDKFVGQLSSDKVPPSVTMAASRDLTRTLGDLADRAQTKETISVVDDWLNSLKDAK